MIKNNICFLLLMAAIGTLSISFTLNQKVDQNLSEEDRLSDKIIIREGKKLGKKFGMRQCGIGGGVDNGIWLMTLAFEKRGPRLSEEEARRLIIACVNDFLDAVNQDEEVRPYLKNYPFTSENINLKIFNYEKSGYLTCYPFISIVGNYKGEIGFFTKDASEKFGYKTEKYETYDEAIAILKKEKS